MPIHPRVLSAAVAAPVVAQRAQPARRAPAPRAPQPQPQQDGDGPFDIIGLGQAVVDYSASVSDELLGSIELAKGGRRVVTVEERGRVMQTLDDMGCSSQVSPGGSLANTLVGIARLARAASQDLRVSMAGSLGNDTLGQYFNSQMSQAGVQVLVEHQLGTAAASVSEAGAEDSCAASEAAVVGHTGTVMVLTTPDAQRSFLSFFVSEDMHLPEPVASAIRNSKIVAIEGYLWEAPGAEAYIHAVVEHARVAGAQVALTAGDPGVVERNRDAILRVLRTGGVDILLANAEEAAALVAALPDQQQQQPHGGAPHPASDGRASALALAQLCPVVVVTDGSRGSSICALGQVHVIPPHWTPHGPLDTCGAGDAYAAGFLYAHAMVGHDLRTSGEFGARVASAVIAQFGPHLGDEDAAALVAQLPEHVGPLRAAGLGSFDSLDMVRFA